MQSKMIKPHVALIAIYVIAILNCQGHGLKEETPDKLYSCGTLDGAKRFGVKFAKTLCNTNTYRPLLDLFNNYKQVHLSGYKAYATVSVGA
jgi:hypothetical protein